MNIIDKLREPKIAGMAIFDWVATIAGAMLFAWATEDTGAQVPRWRYYILVIITFILLGLVSINFESTSNLSFTRFLSSVSRYSLEKSKTFWILIVAVLHQPQSLDNILER